MDNHFGTSQNGKMDNEYGTEGVYHMGSQGKCEVLTTNYRSHDELFPSPRSRHPFRPKVLGKLSDRNTNVLENIV